MVPTGTFSTTSLPSRPVQFEPMPCSPRSPLCSGLNRKYISVLCRCVDSMTTSPPRPPSPPEGPPRGTNFSRRKAMQPLPPSPAFTRIFASSMNMFGKLARLHRRLRAEEHVFSVYQLWLSTPGPGLRIAAIQVQVVGCLVQRTHDC